MENSDKTTAKKKQKSQKEKTEELQNKIWRYETKKWQENRGKFIEFDIKTMNKYKVYYEEINELYPERKEEEGMGVEQLEEPFISLGLAYSREDVEKLIKSVDDDDSGKIEFGEFLRIIHNKSKKKTKGNEKITNFFKKLANNEVSEDKYLNHFSFKTVMSVLRRNNILKAFLAKGNTDKSEGLKILKAYSQMMENKKK
jgi:centrin-1